ncbi:ubiquitin carboxyl-terminal hydrolase 14 [Lactarius akahatsu]|uniref:Ubiquitin carboxyl-terminal hydrolase n=1 Tax=Lactarius akahatsu TaxID=416441 RepID=A0AAD4L813_9AGAM|nr:ubiquitin carboxyl-terminal hydrolase 14 [Lactarius akahatsu]
MATKNVSHIIDEIVELKLPTPSQSVHREECTQCFDNQDGPLGIDLCLTCFNGGCTSPERRHAQTHSKKTGHQLVLNIRRRPRSKPKRDDDAEPPAKMTKLAIVEEREEDKYEHIVALRWYKIGKEPVYLSPDDTTGLTAVNPRVKALIEGVMKSLSSARQEAVQAWEEEFLPCEHTLTLSQLATGHIPPSGLAHCSKCDLKENLWLCLTCGVLGCGRNQYAGVGGNGHALAHFQESTHPVCVKLGTITPEGNADIYCYACNEERIDTELVLHLSNFGINVQAQKKTEKSMTELQIEHNLNYDFSLTDESGKALEPVFGPGLTGIQNLGNSCYMASVVQVLFSLPAFQKRYAAPVGTEHWSSCDVPLPASCLDCQMYKLADGLLSGRYSHPRPTADVQQVPQSAGAEATPPPVFQEGVRPATFKALVGRGHAEFATMRQQDAEEFLTHLLTALRRHAHGARARGTDAEREPTETLAFGLEQRLQCTACAGVSYRVDPHDVLSVPVPVRETGKDAEGRATYEEVQLTRCVEDVLGAEGLEYKCPQCRRDVAATRQARFATFPDTLVVHAKKFQLVNWVPTKLDIPIVLPDGDVLTFDQQHLGRGLQPGETELQDNFNQAALSQLEAMGFPQVRCQKALLATGNSDPEAAMEWLFAHMEDPDIDDPILAAGGPEPSAEQVDMLADMGFSRAQARKALRETSGDAERAVEWLFSHPDDTGEDEQPPPAGSTAATVVPQQAAGALPPARVHLAQGGLGAFGPLLSAHIRTDEGWVLFNDEKVVRADPESVRELKALAYLYVFERDPNAG